MSETDQAVTIESTIGSTESGHPWPVDTNVGTFAKVDGWGRIFVRILKVKTMSAMTREQALKLADDLEQAAVELRAAVNWAETHAAELQGYDR